MCFVFQLSLYHSRRFGDAEVKGSCIGRPGPVLFSPHPRAPPMDSPLATYSSDSHHVSLLTENGVAIGVTDVHLLPLCKHYFY